MNIGWPEGILLAMMALNILHHSTFDGQRRHDRYSGVGSLVGAIVTIGLLYWGGFFT